MANKIYHTIAVFSIGFLFQMCNLTNAEHTAEMSQDAVKAIESYKSELQANNISVNFFDIENTDSIRIEVTIIEPQKLPDLDVEQETIIKSIAELVYDDQVKLAFISQIKVSVILKRGLGETFSIEDYEFTIEDF